MLTKTGCYFSRVFEQTGSNHWTQPYNHNKTEEEFHEGDLYKEFLARGLRVMIYSGEPPLPLPLLLSLLLSLAQEAWRSSHVKSVQSHCLIQ
jgi:hypothetical protein